MLQLYLMRHAKSDWNNYDGDDLKRKVSPIGEKKTQLTKEFILSKNFLPDHVWCSPSIRTIGFVAMGLDFEAKLDVSSVELIK